MRLQRMGSIASAMACLGMVLPSAMATPPAAEANADVALRSGGLLVSQVVDEHGVAKSGMPVSVQYSGKEVGSTITDGNGVFAAKDLRGGQYTLVTPEDDTFCRLCTADTAPPSAQPAALVISDNKVVRRQGALVRWAKSHPYITAGTVAIAIAVPLALASDGHDHGS